MRMCCFIVYKMLQEYQGVLYLEQGFNALGISRGIVFRTRFQGYNT